MPAIQYPGDDSIDSRDGIMLCHSQQNEKMGDLS